MVYGNAPSSAQCPLDAVAGTVQCEVEETASSASFRKVLSDRALWGTWGRTPLTCPASPGPLLLLTSRRGLGQQTAQGPPYPPHRVQNSSPGPQPLAARKRGRLAVNAQAGSELGVAHAGLLGSAPLPMHPSPTLQHSLGSALQGVQSLRCPPSQPWSRVAVHLCKEKWTASMCKNRLKNSPH